MVGYISVLSQITLFATQLQNISFNQHNSIPLPAIHKIEYDLTFKCNDCCDHCLTNSNPNHHLSLDPDDAQIIVRNIKKYSLLERIKKINPETTFSFTPTSVMCKLDKRPTPPKVFSNTLAKQYLTSLHGNEYITKMSIGDTVYTNPFTKPHIRLSGGEFFMWPSNKKNRSYSVEQRLTYQKIFLNYVREQLPDYDVWILTNGRFATDQEKANQVLESWSKAVHPKKGQGCLRLCISTDPFHSPPPKTSTKAMLSYIWKACKEHQLPSPYLYGLPKKEIYYAGRACETMKIHSQYHPPKKDQSFHPHESFMVTTTDLVKNNGCNEVKGFLVSCKDHQSIPANNINIAPDGHLRFCCAQVGDYGDFIHEPESTLHNLVIHPLAWMLRHKKTATLLLKKAVELDPTLQVVGQQPHPEATGFTCYQLLTGKRY